MHKHICACWLYLRVDSVSLLPAAGSTFNVHQDNEDESHRDYVFTLIFKYTDDKPGDEQSMMYIAGRPVILNNYNPIFSRFGFCSVLVSLSI